MTQQEEEVLLKDQRPYDIVVFGVTGYTGTLILDYVNTLSKQQRISKEFRWAAAGRNKSKVNELVRQRCPNVKFDVIVADVQDEKSVFQMASDAWCVVSCIGPYAQVGEAVVKACVSMGTDYVDFTGEADWMASMIKRYDAIAKQNKVVLVPFAGHDSVPADLAAWFAMSQVLPNELQTSHAALVLATRFDGRGISNGTLKSMVGVLENVSSSSARPGAPPLATNSRLRDHVMLLEEVPPSAGGPLAVARADLGPDAYAAWLTQRIAGEALNQKAAQFEVVFSVVTPYRVIAYMASAGLAAAPYVFKLPFVGNVLRRLSDSGAGPVVGDPKKTSWFPSGVGGCQTFGVLRLYPERDGVNVQPLDRVVVRVDEDRDPYLVTAITAIQIAMFLAERKFRVPEDSSCAGPTSGGFTTPVGALGGQQLLDRCFECFRVQRLDVVASSSKL